MTGHKEPRFGLSIEQLEQIYSTVTKYNILVAGLHIHNGSVFKDADAFVKAADILFEIGRKIPNLKLLDFGSGFKVPYKKGDYSTAVEDPGKKISKAFSDFCKSYGKELELWFVPIKFLVSECGNLLVNVNLIKPTPEITFAGIDAGLNHLIRLMMYNAYHDIVNVSNYNVVEYICIWNH